MKLSAIVLLLGAAVASAQTTASQPSQQPAPQQSADEDHKLRGIIEQMAKQAEAARNSCPVELTSATFAPYSMPVRATTDSSANSGPDGLDLGFRNLSGRAIASAELRVHLLVKRSVYDMQTYPLEIALTVRGTGITDGQLDQLQRLALPTGLHPTTVQSVTVAEVTYTDGSTWLPTPSTSGTPACSLNKNPMQLVAK